MKRFLLVFLILISIGAIVVSSLNIAVIGGSKERIYTLAEAEDGSFDCIVVLGAGVKIDGTPSDMLADRLRVAVELYKKGCSDRIFLSGDRSGEDYDEVGAMKRYCLAKGVPEESIICDEIGFSTFESVYNLKQYGEFDSAVIVTQEYHLYRAVYIAKSMGIDAEGVSSSIRSYRGQFARDVREAFARVKDFFKSVVA